MRPIRSGRASCLHPRSRGGNPLYRSSLGSDSGPSPLARGKPVSLCHRAARVGTIPARAGETARSPAHTASPRDHPRSRGGNDTGNPQAAAIPGPSPLARGKRLLSVIMLLLFGTIPARAGETGWNIASCSFVRDHPRSRGGNSKLASSMRGPSRPSPLARGKLPCLRAGRVRAGTIPARAGETVCGC